ncbi:MAG: Smr/MutS family protein [Rhodospirillaceae bacterium]|nr:Smr/MutS family protein [Rhodospirillaceae bacterium]
MAAKRRLTDDELALWQAVAQSVTPLKRKRSKKPPIGDVPAASTERKETTKAPPGKRPRAAKGPAPTPAPTTTAPKPPPLLSPTPTPGAMPGIDKRQGERFRRGQLPIEGKIDLHGRTQAEAHDALQGFIERAFKAGKRKLLVITGKGMTQSKSGVLKTNVPRWLNEPAMRRLVLAISQARPEHGGEGALYVLLKRGK